MCRLNVAASSGFLDIVDLFLGRSCDVNARDRSGTEKKTKNICGKLAIYDSVLIPIM